MSFKILSKSQDYTKASLGTLEAPLGWERLRGLICPGLEESGSRQIGICSSRLRGLAPDSFSAFETLRGGCRAMLLQRILRSGPPISQLFQTVDLTQSYNRPRLRVLV